MTEVVRMAAAGLLLTLLTCGGTSRLEERPVLRENVRMNDSSPARVVVRFAGPDLRPTAPETVAMVVKPDSEWQRLLTPEQYRIARGRGTEPAFCGGLVRIDFGSDAVTYPYASHDWRLSVASSDLGGLWRRR